MAREYRKQLVILKRGYSKRQGYYQRGVCNRRQHYFAWGKVVSEVRSLI